MRIRGTPRRASKGLRERLRVIRKNMSEQVLRKWAEVLE
jgi:hypothetical protein